METRECRWCCDATLSKTKGKELILTEEHAFRDQRTVSLCELEWWSQNRKYLFQTWTLRDPNGLTTRRVLPKIEDEKTVFMLVVPGRGKIIEIPN